MRFSDDDEDADDEALPLALASLAAADERVVRLDALRGAEDYAGRTTPFPAHVGGFQVADARGRIDQAGRSCGR